MKREPFEVVASRQMPGSVAALCRERKMLASNSFRKVLCCPIRIHLAFLIREQPAVFGR
jgi:hypothetical protein